MIFLQLWWALMVLSGSKSGSGTDLQMAPAQPKQDLVVPAEENDKLSSFSRAVEKARGELQELKSSYSGDLHEQDAGQKVQSRERRNSIDDMLANFAQSGEPASSEAENERSLQEAADAWFREIQANMAKGKAVEEMPADNVVSKQERSAKSKAKAKEIIDQHAKAMARTEIGKVKMKYKEIPLETVIQKYEVTKYPFRSDEGGLSSLDIKLKQVHRILSDQENVEAQKKKVDLDLRQKSDASKMEKLPQYGDCPIPDGVYERTLSRLAFPHVPACKLEHEANYKLSKIEQEASEKAMKGVKPFANGLQESDNSQNLKPQKRSSMTGFNPMNEIKLKTSSRLMLKGLGPSLPSNSLLDMHSNHLVDNMIRRRELDEVQQRQQYFDMEQEGEEEDQRLNMNPARPQFEGFEYMQSHGVPNADPNPLMDVPHSYDYRLPQYDRFHSLNQRQMPNVLEYERTNLDLKRLKREPLLQGESQSLHLEAEEDQKALDHDEDAKVCLLEVKGGEAALDSNAKLDESHKDAKLEETPEEAKLTEEHLTKSEAKLEPEALSSDLKGDEKAQVKREMPQEDKLKDNAFEMAGVKPEAEAPTKREISDTASLSSENEAENQEGPEASDLSEGHHDSDQLACKVDKASKAGAVGVKGDNNLKVDIKLRMQEPEVKAPPNSPETHKRDSQDTAPAVPKVNPDAVVKLLANEISLDMNRGKRQTEGQRYRRFSRRQRRSKRSLDGMVVPPANSAPQSDPQSEQHVVAKRTAQLLDDFEDHNGNRVHFGELGNGMLTPDVGDSLGAKPMHQPVEHYDEKEGAAHEGDAVAQIYDPSKNMVPMMNRRPHVVVQVPMLQQQLQQLQLQKVPKLQLVQPEQQSQQQQPAQPQTDNLQSLQRHPNEAASHFKASFNLTHFFNELQKLQNVQAPQQAVPQVQASAASPPVLPSKTLFSHPSKTFGVHRYFGPFKLKNSASDPCATISPNCVPVTTPATQEGGGGESCITGPDVMKLNVSINANVCGNPKTKQFFGNGSINLQHAFKETASLKSDSSQEMPVHVKDERHIRETGEESLEEESGDLKKKARGHDGHRKRPSVKWPRKNKAKVKSNPPETPKVPAKHTTVTDETVSCTKEPECDPDLQDIPVDEPMSESFQKLLTGKTSEEIVAAVFDAVENDPGMDRLLGVLERNRKCLIKRPRNFYQIRNNKNEQHVQQTEQMIRDTMMAISDIIDQQVRQRSCIPLRPDLLDFYDLILKTSEEQEKCREKRQSSLRSLAEDFSQDVRLLDPSKISQKSRIVKKLLRQYEEMPAEDQQAAAGVRDELLMDLVYLRKMADTAERVQRNARLQEILKQTSLDDSQEKNANTEYSPRFIKLLKTAELFKEAGEQQAKEIVGR
ncbi:uncharacterized protein Dana_GF11189 [Drosophila ananassae]|uniref:Uncharacterized protein n=1 Tax=Drosophila ananassae TaxID=7217 RepID=B3MGX8_DROAN|nr:uncharacterized protein Dana_GF11189 [Drosophila ananassae]